ncbi:MAG: squalene--hopene cyclase [Solirubrobacterales bacterium]|nr:squalene--hopene cyclase [Solirubrobacterales bacterium]
MASPIVEARSDAQLALERGCAKLLAMQSQEGWWQAELQSNVTMDAEDMLLREFLGIRRVDQSERSAAWIRSQQREDGTWGNFHGAPGDLSTTIEAYWALRLVGDSPEEEHMRAAARFIRERGGIERARVFTHVWLALFGLWPWEQVPSLPPEIVLLPRSVPLNIYDFACWARQTVVALSVVLAHKPRRALPFALDELHNTEGWTPKPPRSRRGAWLGRLDRALGVYERRPIGALRRLALARAERWIVRRQEADGSWGGIQPPWVYSLMALSLQGYPLDHPVMRRGIEGIERFMIERGPHRRLEACQSPIWDTALAIVALAEAGLPEDDPALARAAQWLTGEEVRVAGDWRRARPQLEPGGWAFEFANLNYPDVDDTAEVVIALLRAGDPDGGAQRAAIERGRRWVEGMVSSDGGWGAFDADNTRALVRELPFLDFGEVIDEPSADVTAHVVEMLALLGRAEERAAQRGIQWLLTHQERDGSWWGRWGVNHIYGTGAAVPALVAAGLGRSHPSVRRAVQWLQDHQNDDGGWGEDPRSYDDPAWIGRGPSTASQTAWALLALDAAGERSPSVRAGVEWLVRTQLADGGWDEPQYTGTGFPHDYYINYHLYRLVFPIVALARCQRGEAG